MGLGRFEGRGGRVGHFEIGRGQLSRERRDRQNFIFGRRRQTLAEGEILVPFELVPLKLCSHRADSPPTRANFSPSFCTSSSTIIRPLPA